MDTCFTKEKEGEGDKAKITYKPVMIEMSLERGGIGHDDQKVPSIDIVTTKFNLPLLIIIPLNSLGVDSVDIGLKWR